MAMAARGARADRAMPCRRAIRSGRVLCPQAGLSRPADHRPGPDPICVPQGAARAVGAPPLAARGPFLRYAPPAEPAGHYGGTRERDRGGYRRDARGDRRRSDRAVGPRRLNRPPLRFGARRLLLHHLVHTFAFFGTESPIPGPDVLADLLGRGRTANHARVLRLRYQPSHRQFEDGMAALAREAFELLQ